MTPEWATSPVLSAIVSALHILALAIGLPGVVVRGRALKRPLDAADFRRLFVADNAWGIAAALWAALYAVNHVELVLVVVIVFVASFMARGFGLR